MPEPFFPTIVGKLHQREPKLGHRKAASVAIIIDDKSSPKVLLIQRAERKSDPWSGQVAFPGGKAMESDKSLRETAERETMEEVGLDLARDSRFLGYFEPFTTHTGTMDVVPSVFLVQGSGEVKTNGEVASYRWISLEDLFSDGAKGVYKFDFRGENVEMPAFKVEGYVVWGLTHRIITALLA